ncbi:ALG1 chitobiosyldiphosphodolichol beta-mannosyltransferase [Carabus blaptoides fortunei]
MCVTNAMKDDLKKVWNINAVTLYDKPPEIFHTISLEDKHKLLCRLAKQYPALGDMNDTSKSAFTQLNSEGKVELRENRPALLISSTSWTEDEDFSLLLTAFESYEESCQNGNPRKLPKLICVITGKGPLKEYYVTLIQKQAMQHVSVITPWLESSDYPLILASADLGVCLHTSSSGLDLPMKVVDMFGCCLPVCAYNFNCLHELVKHDINSYVFKDSNELAQQLLKWFENYPNNEQQQQIERKFKTELHKFQEIRWETNWKQNAFPLFQ